MIELNPFVFNRPVEPDELIDRDEEAERLLRLAEGGHASRLSAPRRYGKTSLLRRIGRDADLAGMNYVEVDFYGVLSATDVIGRLAEAYARLRPPLRRIAIAALETLKLKVTLGGGPLRIEAQPVSQPEASHLVGELLDLPLTLYERNGTRSLVAFDEFQVLLAVGGGIDGLFRSRIQRHGDAASYVFAGSHPGLMNELFGRQERPFFGQARVFHLDPLAGADLVEYIGTRFEATKRDATPVLGPLVDLARGHPQRAMLLAHHLWEQTPPGERATPELWQAALGAALTEQAEALEAAWDAHGPSEQSVMAALALSADPLFAERTLRRFNLSRGGAQHARGKLARMGSVHEVGRRWELVDPLLAEWIGRLDGRAGLR
ncbi:MAG TPA: hypothetical protein VMS60_01660 [Solirubrobacterales bacterium]|nr:hypothetical protein [Solirubrobacterales bacterium]